MSKYISLENLERYDAKMQERIASFCASKEDGMWRQTEKAGAVSFWPVGNSPLEGTVEFIFKETGPASGTKSPDNPSTISGVSSIGLTVCQEEGVDEHTYTLSLGSTYYGGSIDLATGLMTVTHRHNQLTGSNATLYFNQTIGTYKRYSLTTIDSVRIDTAAPYENQQACTHFRYAAYWTLDEPHFYVSTQSPGAAYLYTDIDTVAGLKEWLTAQYQAGTPMEYVYPIAEPFTVQLTPPQIRALSQPNKYVPRLNTIYSDADAVQIVYQKNPVRDKFEKVQAIIAQGGNV